MAKKRFRFGPFIPKKGSNFAIHLFKNYPMGYQSTKNKYLTRREKNQEAYRRFRIIFWFGLLIAFIWFVKDWRDHWAYFKTYLMD